MAYTPVTITGQVADSSGVLTTINGRIHFSLSQAGTCTSGGFAIAAGADTSFVITNGVIAALSVVTGNDDITPTGTYYVSRIVSDDGAIIAIRNYSILLANGASQTIASLAAPSTPFSSGTGIPSSRLFATTAPLTGGGDLSADRTLGASVSPGGAGTLVGTTRQILTSAPIAGGGDLSADRTISIAGSGGGTSVVGTGRLINTTAPITGGGDLSADRTLALTTSPAGQTPVGVTRLITTTTPIQIGGGASANLSDDRTIAFANQNANLLLSGPVSGGAAAPTFRAQVIADIPVMDSCRVYNSANISVPNAAFTALTFDTERYDTNGLHSTASNTSRLTAARTGVYLITGNIFWAGNAAGALREVGISVNGSTTVFIARALQAPTANAIGLTVATLWTLSATNYVELLAYQDTGGNLNVTALLNESPEFAMSMISN